MIDRLLDFIDEKEVLTFLSEHGIIAGGSIAYALNKFVPEESVGDIDVFINSKEVFKQILNYLLELGSDQTNLFDIRWGNNDISIYAYEKEILTDSPIVSQLTIHNIPGIRKKIQLVCKPWKTPMKLLTSFDLDYIQCGYYKGKLYMTDQCKKAHKTGTVSYFNDMRLKYERLTKAQNKGFKTFMLASSKEFKPNGDESNRKMIKIDPEDLKNQKIQIKETNYYFPTPTDSIYVDFNKLALVGWEPVREYQFSDSSNVYGQFIFSDGTNQIKKEIVGTEIEVEKWFPANENIDRPAIVMKNKILGVDKIMLAKNMYMKPGKKYVVLMSIRIYTHKDRGTKFVLNVHKIYSVDDLIIPFQLDNLKLLPKEIKKLNVKG